MKKNIHPFLFSFLILLCFPSFNVVAQKWDTLAPIPESFTFPVVAVVDGKIHIMGGGGSGGATNHHYAYDPVTDTWEPRAPVPYLAQQPAGAAAKGKIHFFGGGYPNTGHPLDDHFVYDPISDSWEVAAILTAPRAIHYAVAVNDALYSLAGQGMANLCQTYDDTLDAWITKNNLPDNGFWYGAHVVTEGHIYRFCGGGYTAPNKLAHRYDPESDTWASLPMFPAATHGISGAAIGTKIFLAGGYHDFLDRDEVWIFDTETETYSAGTPLPIGRTYHSMAAVDDCIYVLGGNNAIDTTIGLQLLRLCPFENTSTVDANKSSMLNVHYDSGKLTIQTMNDRSGPSQLSVFDMAGRQVYHDKLDFINIRNGEIWIGSLYPAVYIIRLQQDNTMYVGKVVVNE